MCDFTLNDEHGIPYDAETHQSHYFVIYFREHYTPETPKYHNVINFIKRT